MQISSLSLNKNMESFKDKIWNGVYIQSRIQLNNQIGIITYIPREPYLNLISDLTDQNWAEIRDQLWILRIIEQNHSANE